MILELKNIEVELNMEKTVVILKPSIPDEEFSKRTVISRDKFKKIFERIIQMKWYKTISRKTWVIDTQTAENHYSDKREHPLFPEVIRYITSDISDILSIEWENSINDIRSIALRMREKYIWNWSKLYNMIHASDSEYESKKEHQIHFSS